jgi:hypothetical protein
VTIPPTTDQIVLEVRTRLNNILDDLIVNLTGGDNQTEHTQAYNRIFDDVFPLVTIVATMDVVGDLTSSLLEWVTDCGQISANHGLSFDTSTADHPEPWEQLELPDEYLPRPAGSV